MKRSTAAGIVRVRHADGDRGPHVQTSGFLQLAIGLEPRQRCAALDHAGDACGQVLPMDPLERVERRPFECRRKRASSPPAFRSRPVGSPAASFTMAPPAGLA